MDFLPAQAAVALLGPRRGGVRYAAYTDWNVSWSYAPTRATGGFRPASARVHVVATCTLPRWRPPRAAEPALVEAWRAYLAAVALHERGHIALAAAAGRAVRHALQTLPASGSAADLDASVRVYIGAVLVDFRTREVAYDEATGHGAAQGVHRNILGGAEPTKRSTSIVPNLGATPVR